MENLKRRSIVKLPSDVQLPVFLIREEIKARKLFRALRKVGLNDCYYQPHLDTLIMCTMGFDAEADETFAVYDAIMAKRSRKIKPNYDSVLKHALKAYYELLHAKKNLRQSTNVNPNPVERHL